MAAWGLRRQPPPSSLVQKARTGLGVRTTGLLANRPVVSPADGRVCTILITVRRQAETFSDLQTALGEACETLQALFERNPHICIFCMKHYAEAWWIEDERFR